MWIRNLVKALAAEGRTVFLSSHLMSEMAITADRLVIIGRGRLIAQTTVEDLLNGSGSLVRVRSPQSDALATLLQARGVTVARQSDDTLHARDVAADLVGELACANGVTLQELSMQHASLEQRYMELTGDAVDYRTAQRALVPAANPK
jgi:ABC-2 type transport system ATP-binding protein